MSEPRRRRRLTPWFGPQAVLRPVRGVLAFIVRDDSPLELQIVGRTLLQAALVGAVAGLFGCAFLAALEHVEQWLLVDLCNLSQLQPAGLGKSVAAGGPLRWWLLLFVPAVGGVVSGLVTRLAPETRGGGGDAAIAAFHEGNGVIRRRVLWVKAIGSIATLGTGGAGGREGPTMQIGAAIGSLVGRYLSLSDRSRRILMVAGIGAGISAVFRTPLGAALLAIEVLYRDDFESEALIPCVLASVIAYSISSSVFGVEPLFGDLPAFPFHASQLPLFLGLALVISLGATLFERVMATARQLFKRIPGPDWLRPGVGGLALGMFVVFILLTVGPTMREGHGGLGLLGGGYGAGQVAITGASWLEPGWTTVEVLLLLALTKIVASSMTIGSGGAAGDFAPSIAIGGLLGGAFGSAAQLVLHDPSIQPGAFALVGMAAFYAGIANVPLAALVMVCEVAGSYDLLVPLMLTEGVAMIALRKVNLYRSQPRTTHDSPVHAGVLARLRCGDVIDRQRRFVTIARELTIAEAATAVDHAAEQDVFPVIHGKAIVGLLSAESLRGFVSDVGDRRDASVSEVMVTALVFQEGDPLGAAATALVRRDLRAAPVIDRSGQLIGMLDQHDVVRALS